MVVQLFPFPPSSPCCVRLVDSAFSFPIFELFKRRVGVGIIFIVPFSSIISSTIINIFSSDNLSSSFVPLSPKLSLISTYLIIYNPHCLSFSPDCHHSIILFCIFLTQLLSVYHPLLYLLPQLSSVYHSNCRCISAVYRRHLMYSGRKYYNSIVLNTNFY